MSLEELRDEFHEALEGLKEVHTQEALDKQKKLVELAKEKLYEADQEFREFIRKNKERAKQRSMENKFKYSYEHEKILRETKNKVETIRREAKLNIVKTTTTPREINFEKLEKELVCPICKGNDKGNVINDKPFCFNCQHELVSKEDLSKYNRAYRRRWTKRLKK